MQKTTLLALFNRYPTETHFINECNKLFSPFVNLQAVYVEMDVERLQAYIVFLSQHISELNKDELDELVEVSL